MADEPIDVQRAIAQLEGLTRQGEDNIWRPAKRALDAIKALRVQNGALRTMNRLLEDEIALHRGRRDLYHAAIATLDSEKAANAQLTDEVEDRRDAIIAAYVAGAEAVHENYRPDRDPDFYEAASNYAASLTRAEPGL